MTKQSACIAWAWIRWGAAWVWYGFRVAAAVLVRAHQIAEERAAHAYDRVEPWTWEDPTEEPEDLEMLRRQKETLYRLLDSIEIQLEETTDPKQTTALLTRQATTQNKLTLIEARLRREEEKAWID